jgi:hypothetical protein
MSERFGELGQALRSTSAFDTNGALSDVAYIRKEPGTKTFDAWQTAFESAQRQAFAL